MIQNLILSIGLSFAIGLNGAKDNNHNFINNDIPNNVVYNDNDNTITLTPNELNNYTWVNFSAFLETLSINNVEDYPYIEYNEEQLVDVDSLYADRILIYGDTTPVVYFNETVDYGEANKFTIYEKPDNNQIEFEYNLLITFESETSLVNYYDDFKTAIQADIAANTTQPSMGNTIINAIKSGLGLIGDLASQFLLGFSTLFWANNALTPFGTFALVFLGISITMAVVSLVLRLIRGNTGA